MFYKLKSFMNYSFSFGNKLSRTDRIVVPCLPYSVKVFDEEERPASVARVASWCCDKKNKKEGNIQMAWFFLGQPQYSAVIFVGVKMVTKRLTDVTGRTGCPRWKELDRDLPLLRTIETRCKQCKMVLMRLAGEEPKRQESSGANMQRLNF